MQEPEVHKNRTEARAGSTPGMMRWILILSTGLAAIAMAILLWVW
jgi:hypothetical protein